MNTSLIQNIHSYNQFDAYQVTKIHFQEERNFINFLEVFNKYLPQQSSLSTMRATSLGCTGFTFLCDLNNSDLELELNKRKIEQINASEAVLLGFVLKWQNHHLAEVEQMCADFFRKNAFSAPVVQIAPKELASSLGKKAAEIKPSFASISTTSTLIGMPKFHASTFDGIMKNQKFFELSISNWKEMLIKFGKAAFFDLIIGNDDRFFRIDCNNSQNFLSQKPILNSGNVMIECETSGYETRLKNVHFIDNATSQSLLSKMIKEERGSQDEEVDLSMFGTDSDDEEDEINSTHQISNSNIEINVSDLHRAFIYLSSNPKELTTYISRAIISWMQEEYGSSVENHKEKFEQFEQMIDKCLFLGLQQGRDQAMLFKLEGFGDKGTLTPACKLALDLIEKNLQYLKNKNANGAL